MPQSVHLSCLASVKLADDGLSFGETMLAGTGMSLAATIPAGLLAGALLERGSLREDASRHEKSKNTTDAKKIIQYVAKVLAAKPKVHRKKTDFSPSESAMSPATNEVHVSYYGHPALLAHELGHAANIQQDRQHVLGRALSGMTNLSYTPLPEVASLSGLAGFALDVPEVGIAGVGAAGLLSALQLVEEARASMKARKILKDIYGDKLKSKDYMLPLGSGFGTYLAHAVARVGAPIGAEVLQEAYR